MTKAIQPINHSFPHHSFWGNGTNWQGNPNRTTGSFGFGFNNWPF